MCFLLFLFQKYVILLLKIYVWFQSEFEIAETKDFKAVKHQSFVGTSYFDAVQNTVAGGESSTAALKESTEADQFNRRAA